MTLAPELGRLGEALDLLAERERDFAPFQDKYWFLFNSYYEGVGPRYNRPERGLISRPGAHDVGVYRANVDDRVRDLLTTLDDDALARAASVIERSIRR